MCDKSPYEVMTRWCKELCVFLCKPVCLAIVHALEVCSGLFFFTPTPARSRKVIMILTTARRRICTCNWIEMHYKHSIKADRTGKFVFTDMWPDLTAVNLCSTEAPRHLYLSALIWLALGAEVECASEKSPVWCGSKDVLCLNKHNICQEKKKRQKQQL